MQQLIAANPFALMMDPQTVLDAMERSERLAGLRSCIYRPLDKPLIPRVGKDVAAFDDEVDGAIDEAMDDGADLEAV